MGRHRKLGLWLSSDMTAWAYLITRKLLDKMSPPSSIVIRLQVSGHVIVIMIDMLPHHVSLTTRGYGVQDQWKNFIMMYASVYHKIGVQCMQSHMTTTVYPWITGWLEKLQKNFNISTTSMLSKPFSHFKMGCLQNNVLLLKMGNLPSNRLSSFKLITKFKACCANKDGHAKAFAHRTHT